MFHTSKIAFGLRTISLFDGKFIIFKAIGKANNTARYVPTQENAIEHTIWKFGIGEEYDKVYTTHDNPLGLIETIYRRNYT